MNAKTTALLIGLAAASACRATDSVMSLLVTFARLTAKLPSPSRILMEEEHGTVNEWITLAHPMACDCEGKSILIPLHEVHPNIKVEMRYATAKNITGMPLYSAQNCGYIRAEIAQDLRNVQDELETMGMGLVVWDALEPKEVQKMIWDAIANESLVVNPNKTIDPHARGMAVDVTLRHNEKTRRPSMPTDFDDITIKADPLYPHHPKAVKKNLRILMQVMEKHGFICKGNWWHFEHKDWRSYPGIDCPIQQSEQ